MEAGPEQDGKPQRVLEQTEARVEVERAEGCLAGHSAQDGDTEAAGEGTRVLGEPRQMGPSFCRKPGTLGWDLSTA